MNSVNMCEIHTVKSVGGNMGSVRDFIYCISWVLEMAVRENVLLHTLRQLMSGCGLFMSVVHFSIGIDCVLFSDARSLYI